MPIYDPGLDELVERNVKAGRLQFTTDLTTCLDAVEVVFSAVGTPPDEDGSADLKYVLEVARAIGRNINKEYGSGRYSQESAYRHPGRTGQTGCKHRV